MESSNYGSEQTACVMQELSTIRNPYSTIFMVSV
jgi:hypothetical protein